MSPAPRIAAPSTVAASALAGGLAQLATELELPGPFAADAQAEATAATADGLAANRPTLVGGNAREDHTDLPLVTLDPLGSRDLDQAFAIEPAEAGGTRLHYAIADVAAHVAHGGAIDAESRRRGETIYLPGRRLPLHPPELSEGAASLLPGERRLAVLWSIEVDAAGDLRETQVRRAVVRSTAQLDYASAAAALAAGTPHPQIAALADLGPRLVATALRRGAIDLPEPEQELVDDGAGGFTVSWLPRDPVEDWNAQLSLLTGRAAARVMLEGRSGLLRTLPPPPPDAEPRLRTVAAALQVDWPAGEALSTRLARLDPGAAPDLALMDAARTLLRGAGYLPLTGQTPEPGTELHAAVAAPYAHVTAPLRRLADRFATECALAVAAGVEPPDWATAALPDLPTTMTAAGRRSGAVARGVIDLAEAIVLAPHVGETYDAAVVAVTPKAAEIRLDDPPVQGRADPAGLVAGSRRRVVLVSADPGKRSVRFAAAAAD
ncbi:MAG: RNB domain-containing ribonuclease [Solirubrobacteraceae bacterium]|nr:RNB domain-containing ribonuclease [Patulibacter sp.]